MNMRATSKLPGAGERPTTRAARLESTPRPTARVAAPPAAASIDVSRKLAAALVVAILGTGAALFVRAVSRTQAPGEAAFEVADARIAASRDEVAFGNTPQAVTLARALSVGLSEHPLPFEGRGEESAPVSVPPGKFLTHCQVGPRGVCFLVHVPQLEHYKGDARGQLLSHVWALANAAAREHLAGELARGSELAIGLREELSYGATGTGQLGAEWPASRQLAGAISTGPLHPFFAPFTGTVAAGSTPAPGK